MSLLKKTMVVEPDGAIATFGPLFFRVSAGLMIFYIHGLHKLEGWIAYLQHGTPWELAKEVAGMHFPAPLASAVAATLVQFICSLFIVVGLFTRINATLLLELHPQHALIPRVIYVASESDSIVGFIAGHLTRRFACEGEVEWINVIPERRGSRIASELLRLLAGWFVEQKASLICVDVDPANTTARCFYRRHGAQDLNEHWLVWNNISVVLGE